MRGKNATRQNTAILTKFLGLRCPIADQGQILHARINR